VCFFNAAFKGRTFNASNDKRYVSRLFDIWRVDANNILAARLVKIY
jgi:hypothetical protein